MKYLKTYEASGKKVLTTKSSLMEVNELDSIIMDIFSDLTDIGYSLEVMHQNGYASYHVLPPKSYSNIVDQFGFGNNLGEAWLSGKDLLLNLGSYANMLSEVSKELPGIHGRIMEIPGLEKFKIYSSGHIEMSFNHKQQGYGNLGNVMLVGPTSKSIYRG